jgi:hypothetical protein
MSSSLCENRTARRVCTLCWDRENTEPELLTVEVNLNMNLKVGCSQRGAIRLASKELLGDYQYSASSISSTGRH